MKNRYSAATAAITACMFLYGCGGGGSDYGSTVTPVTSFALQAGYKARVTAGATDNFSVSGTCSGSATITTSAATPAAFEGVAGYSVTTTLTRNLTDCTPASSAVTSTGYYDSNYAPIGSSTPGIEYAKFLAAPLAIPTAVKVGDTATLSTLTLYSDSTKATVTGQRLLSYVIEADTATTAIANLISKAYNTSSQLLFTQQSRYRIAADGTLSVISIDVQESTTGTTHLLYTKI